MQRETVQLFFKQTDANTESALNDLARQWPGLQRQQLGRNIEGSWGAGAFTWDLWWDGSAPDIAQQLRTVPGFERADRVTYASIGGGARDAQLRGGIWRTLLLRVRDNASREHIQGVETDLLRMPQYMAGIRNWNLSRVTSDSKWTHVWQQEYTQLGDLLGEYLVHPFHWGRVDRWFDPEFPEWTVGDICHAFCPLEKSLLG